MEDKVKDGEWTEVKKIFERGNVPGTYMCETEWKGVLATPTTPPPPKKKKKTKQKTTTTTTTTHKQYGFLSQEVYDWAGAEANLPLYFTLHRNLGAMVRHDDAIAHDETLNLIERVSKNVNPKILIAK